MKTDLSNSCPPKVVVLASLEADSEAMRDFISTVGPQVLSVVVASSSRPLNRYNIRPGRFFGKKNKPGDKYQIVDLAGDVVIYRNMKTDRKQYAHLNDLLDWWNGAGLVEITRWEEITSMIEKYLTPYLGAAVVGALIAWLMGRLK